MIRSLMRFVECEELCNFQILDGTPPKTRPSSPILSWSPDLFSRFRINSEDEDKDEFSFSFSPCSSSTPQKLSPLNLRADKLGNKLNHNETGEHITQSMQSSKMPLKRKGLSTVDGNVPSPTSSKRFRFEEHCIDYESIEKKEEENRNRRRNYSMEKEIHLENRLANVKQELVSSNLKLEALKSICGRSVHSHVQEVNMRKRALGVCQRILQRRIADSRINRMDSGQNR